MPNAGKEAGACVWPSTLRKVVTTAIADAERAGMTGRTRDEWVSIAILASPLIPLGSHFPTEGGGPCPRCCVTEAEVEALAEVMTDADCASSEYPFSDQSRARAVIAAGYRRVFPPAADRGVPMSDMRGTGGNQFIEADATRGDLLKTINDQLGDLHEYAAQTGRVLDLAEVTISTRRIPSGRISVMVTADLATEGAPDARA